MQQTYSHTSRVDCKNKKVAKHKFGVNEHNYCIFAWVAVRFETHLFAMVFRRHYCFDAQKTVVWEKKENRKKYMLRCTAKLYCMNLSQITIALNQQLVRALFQSIHWPARWLVAHTHCLFWRERKAHHHHPWPIINKYCCRNIWTAR